MAIKVVRDQRKNADGTYDIIHHETQAKVVWLSDGRSVEEAVASGSGADCATDEEILEFIMKMGYENPVISDTNAIYTNGENVIYTL